MVRKNLYEKLGALGVNVAAEYHALITLFKSEKIISLNYTNHTLLWYVNEYYFRSLPREFRTPYLSVYEMMIALNIKDDSRSLDDLLLLSEFLIALLPEEKLAENIQVRKQAYVIFENIISFLEKLNYELFEMENGRIIIVEKNPATTQAVEIVEDAPTSLALIEYNHYALKGNLDEKRRILNALGSYIEPILRSRALQKAGYNQLESDVGFMLNSFHVRHNNKVGAKAQDYIVSLNDTQLEEWYDKLYNAILAVIIINDHIPTQTGIESLKKTYNWRS